MHSIMSMQQNKQHKENDKHIRRKSLIDDMQLSITAKIDTINEQNRTITTLRDINRKC